MDDCAGRETAFPSSQQQGDVAGATTLTAAATRVRPDDVSSTPKSSGADI